jgi:transposase
MKRASMRRIREVLRLHHECGLVHRAISAATGLSKGSVYEYLHRAAQAGVTWEVARELDDAELEARLFREPGRNRPLPRVAIDFEWVHRERRRTGVTLQLLWVEYREACVDDAERGRPYGYTQFCDLYRTFRGRLDVTMRQTHLAGEKLFVDYSGKKAVIYDRKTGEAVEVELYVAVMGASNYTFAEATRTQGLVDFVASTVRAFEYMGGVPQIVVPDQLRSAVSKPARHDPEINQTYAEMAAHYGAVVIPARPRKPRDKAKVEVAVQIAQRWILARLRNIVFFSLDDLNAAIAELLEELNTRPFRKLEGCRHSQFLAIDRPAMKPLPAHRYEIAEWKKARANIDYHVEFDHRYYSVPHGLAQHEVMVRATTGVVEILHGGRRVASYRRSYGPKWSSITDPAHRPKSHRDYGNWPPSRLVSWGESLGPSVAAVVCQILESRPHPEMGYRSCLALMRDAKTYGDERTEAACRRALAIGSATRKSVHAILKTGLDRAPIEIEQPELPMVEHDNVRGGEYYVTDHIDTTNAGHDDRHKKENDA